MDLNNNLANMKLKVKCDLCEKSFFGEFLLKHMRIAHPGAKRPSKKKGCRINLQPTESDFKFFCKFCKKGFAIKRKMISHKKWVHLTKGNKKKKNSKAVEKLIWKRLKPMEDGRVKCLNCCKTYSNRSIAKIHYKKVHCDRFICTVCSKDFPAENCMQKHVKAAHMLPSLIENGENKKLDWKIAETNEEGRFNCFDCNKTFSTFRTAKAHHKNVHMSDQNAFKCEVCLKYFKLKRSLHSHMLNIHTADKIDNNFNF